jgi:hypothetical protein
MTIRLTRTSVAFALALGAQNIEDYMKIMEAVNGVANGVHIANNSNYSGDCPRGVDNQKERKVEK